MHPLKTGVCEYWSNPEPTKNVESTGQEATIAVFELGEGKDDQGHEAGATADESGENDNGDKEIKTKKMNWKKMEMKRTMKMKAKNNKMITKMKMKMRAKRGFQCGIDPWAFVLSPLDAVPASERSFGPVIERCLGSLICFGFITLVCHCLRSHLAFARLVVPQCWSNCLRSPRCKFCAVPVLSTPLQSFVFQLACERRSVASW